MAGKPWLRPSHRSVLTLRPDQAQIPKLGEHGQRISTRFETQPTVVMLMDGFATGRIAMIAYHFLTYWVNSLTGGSLFENNSHIRKIIDRGCHEKSNRGFTIIVHYFPINNPGTNLSASYFFNWRISIRMWKCIHIRDSNDQ